MHRLGSGLSAQECQLNSLPRGAASPPRTLYLMYVSPHMYIKYTCAPTARPRPQRRAAEKLRGLNSADGSKESFVFVSRWGGGGVVVLTFYFEDVCNSEIKKQVCGF